MKVIKRRRRVVVDNSALAQRVGGRIRKARLNAGLTQQQVAGERYSKAYISALEKGSIKPSVAALDYLAGRLGVSSSSLLAAPEPAWSRVEADVLLAAGDWQRAVDAYEALLGRAAGEPERAELLTGLAEAYARLDRGRDAIEAGSTAAELFAGVDRKSDARLARYWLASGLYQTDQLDESRSLLRMVLDEVRATGDADPDFRLRLLIALAAVDIRARAFESALAHLSEAKGLAPDLDGPRRATHLFSLAASYREAGDYEGAVRLGLQSLGLYRAAAAERETASIENDLALAYLGLGQVKRAAELAATARESFATLGDDRWLAHVTETQAQIDLAAGDYAGASERADEALRLSEQSGNSKARVSALLSRARANRGLGDQDAALRDYAAAADLSRGGTARQSLREALLEWGELLASQGKHQDAYQLLREAAAD